MIWIYQMPLVKEEGKSKRETEWLAGKQMLERGLKEHYGLFDLKYAIDRGVHGKPFLAHFPQIHYNISHTDQMIVCGIGDVELGIDVELIRPFKESMIKGVLSEAERKDFYKLPEKERPEYFFRIWTLKESYGKAKGCGLSMALTGLSFHWNQAEKILCSDPEAVCFQTVLKGGFVLSVCTFTESRIEFS